MESLLSAETRQAGIGGYGKIDRLVDLLVGKRLEGENLSSSEGGLRDDIGVQGGVERSDPTCGQGSLRAFRERPH